MYVITGATGNTGRVVAERLLDAGRKVRVVGRSAERLRPLVQKGGEAVVADISDTDALTKAFAGARAVYALIPPDPTVEDVRGYQRSIAESLATGLERSGVRHAVFLSSVGAHLPDGTGPIAGLHEAEERLKRVPGINILHLRPSYFMENLLMFLPTIQQAGVAGSAVAGDVPIPMIATRDIGEYAARRLLELNFTGYSTRELLGQRDVSLGEAASVLGRAIDRPDLKYVQFPYADAEQAMVDMGLGRDMARLYTEMSRAMNEGRVAPQEQRSRENTTPTSIEDFAPIFAAAAAGAG
jgi:uncharacterized protein YbjT (DUF2867 family)